MKTRIYLEDRDGGVHPVEADRKVILRTKRGHKIQVSINADGEVMVHSDEALIVCPRATNRFYIQVRE